MSRVPILVLFAMLLAPATGAHPGHARGTDHEHGERVREPSKEQIARQLERVVRRAEERREQRDQRRKDRRRALAKELFRRLRGGPVTTEVRAELEQHARRTSLLRQIRYVAAKEDDHASVVDAERALARENARHEAWWRKRRRAEQPKPETP
jgi:hypothetical protein